LIIKALTDLHPKNKGLTSHTDTLLHKKEGIFQLPKPLTSEN